MWDIYNKGWRSEHGVIVSKFVLGMVVGDGGKMRSRRHAAAIHHVIVLSWLEDWSSEHDN